MLKKRRLIFAGTSEFAVPTLRQLIAGPHELLAVLTQPDRPAGRGRKLKPSPIKQLATAQQIPLYQPDTLDINTVQNIDPAPDLLIVVAYGVKLSEAILSWPTWGCLNCHPSMLPRWRGAAPIQHAIMHGDQQTAVCIMQMDKGMDTGPILSQKSVAMLADETSGECHLRLAELGAQQMSHVIDHIEEALAAAQPQPSDGQCYAPKIQKAQTTIDWSQSAQTIHNQVRAMNPDPVATTYWGKESIRIWRTQLTEGRSTKPPGHIIGSDATGVLVACGAQETLRILALQRPGKTLMTGRDLANHIRQQPDHLLYFHHPQTDE